MISNSAGMPLNGFVDEDYHTNVNSTVIHVQLDLKKANSDCQLTVQ